MDEFLLIFRHEDGVEAACQDQSMIVICGSRPCSGTAVAPAGRTAPLI